MRKRILDQPIDLITIDEAIYRAQMAFAHPRQLKIITLNPEMIINATKNIDLQAAINNSHLVVPDGTGIVWALKLNGAVNSTRIPGIELAEKILDLANKFNKKVALFGGTKNILEKTIVVLKEKYPNLNIVKAIDGFQGKENDKKSAIEIANTKPDLVLVALGSPKQEVWINKYSNLFPTSVMMGIGGSFDIWSGKKKRAPLWARNNHLEWLFRVIIEPQRIPRVLRALPIFIYKVLKAKSQLHAK